MHTDPRSDLYSFGATLYRLLSGHVPVDVTARLATPGLLPPLRAVNAGVSAQMEWVVVRALEVRAEDRFASAVEMKQAMLGAPLVSATYPAAMPIPATSPYVVAPFAQPHTAAPVLGTPPLVAPQRRGGALAMVLIAIVMVAAVVMAVGLGQPELTRSFFAAAATPTVGVTAMATAHATSTLIPRTTATLAAGAIQWRGNDNAEMVYVPAGEFLMGSRDSDLQAAADEKPQHTIYLDAFWIDKYEVTNALYKRCVDAGKCLAPPDRASSTRNSYYGNSAYDNHSVIYVSWDDANAYCRWADKRLPIEAEWEKAARGTEARIWPWGNTFDASRLNSREGARGDTIAVGGYPNGASPYGALDMAGNVFEWVADWYDPIYYKSAPSRNPSGPSSGGAKVLRGGSWNDIQDYARAANRGYMPVSRDNYIGFRCAQTADVASAVGSPTAMPTVIPSTATPKPAEMAFVPAGDFVMGTNDGLSAEKPMHTVFLEAFWIDKFEVTNAQYKQCANAGKCEPPRQTSTTRSAYYGNPQYDNFPVIYVSWNGARIYCEWAGKRLPTEAEWERAARGQDGRLFPWGSAWDGTKANSWDSTPRVGDTTAVGSYLSGVSPSGTFDMAGNVSEWVADWYNATYYANSPRHNPKGPDSGNMRVTRGGSWSDVQYGVRVTTRRSVSSSGGQEGIGFRCAL
jgi:formylglycine-generating enzyme required for sulfatase activity